jgi:hypothetical protein
MRRTLLAVLLALPTIGCVSRAGPFVTNISSAGNGRLYVQRCYVEYSDTGKEISNQDCREEIVDLNAPPRTASAEPRR